MPLEDVQTHLWKSKISLKDDPIRSQMLGSLGTTFTRIEYSERAYHQWLQEDLDIAAGYAKLYIIETWTHREILRKMGISVDKIDKVLPNLKKFRDAIAHLEERIQKKIIVNRKKISTQPETVSLAGGKLHIEGKIWKCSATAIYNLEVDALGIFTAFGICDDFLITNTEKGCIDLLMTQEIVDILERIIRKL